MSGYNNKVRKVATNTVVADIQLLVAPTTSFNQGDLLMMDATNHLVKRLVGETDGANFLGIAPVTIVNGKYPSGYNTSVDASVGTPSLPGPEFGDEFSLVLKSGDTLHAGDAVYADPATGNSNVQAAGTKIIGVYTGAEGASITGDGTKTVSCKIGARYPADTLKF